ncbi:MAG: hypothetical protein ABIZ52_00455 [Candidatus Limnocylindrales bacterium]
MTSETTTKVPTTKTATSSSASSRGGKDMLQTAMTEVRGAVDGVRRTVPEVARASRGAFDDMVKAMETGSDDRTQAGVTLSLGLAVGMLLGGAPRILVLLALAPVAAMALVLGDRRARRARATSAA